MAAKTSQRSGLWTETGVSGVWSAAPTTSAIIASGHVVVLPYGTSAVLTSALYCSGTTIKGQLAACGPLSVFKYKGSSIRLCSVGYVENTGTTYKLPKGNYGG